MKPVMSFAPYVTFVLVLAAGAYHQWLLAVLFLGSAIIWVGDVFEGICRTLDQELQARDNQIADSDGVSKSSKTPTPSAPTPT
jgi:hypothetical protein